MGVGAGSEVRVADGGPDGWTGEVGLDEVVGDDGASGLVMNSNGDERAGSFGPVAGVGVATDG